ncbi:hypothetical protein [Amycolatopsis acidiphila]|nr:hypothetical protein [Amycolatopsis acidiphila]
MQAGEKAEVLYARALSFCVDQGTDGFISDLQLTRAVGHGMRDAMKRAQILSETVTGDGDTLWTRDDVRGGFWVTAWLRWNKSVEEIEALREKDAARKGKRPPLPPGPDGEKPKDSGRNPNGIPTESDRTPSAKTLQDKTTTTSRQEEPSAPDGSDLFSEFWDAYPRKAGKAAARKAWPKAVKAMKATEDATSAERLVAAARYWAGLWERADIETQYIPHPATWLNGKRWDDEPPPPKLRAVSGGYQPYRNPDDQSVYDEPLG